MLQECMTPPVYTTWETVLLLHHEYDCKTENIPKSGLFPLRRTLLRASYMRAMTGFFRWVRDICPPWSFTEQTPQIPSTISHLSLETEEQICTAPCRGLAITWKPGAEKTWPSPTITSRMGTILNAYLNRSKARGTGILVRLGQCSTISGWSKSLKMHSAPYQACSKARKLEKQVINQKLAMVVIKPAQTEWPSLTVFVLEKHGTLHFCVDHKKLNPATVCDAYPVQRASICIL